MERFLPPGGPIAPAARPILDAAERCCRPLARLLARIVPTPRAGAVRAGSPQGPASVRPERVPHPPLTRTDTMRAIITATLGACLAASTAGIAFAHAHLKTATPAPDSTVQAAPASVAITFTEAVEPKFSSIEVQDAGGKRVDHGDAHVDPGDNKLFSVGLTPIQPGTYKVTWHATAVDTHKTDGSFQFTVKP